MLQADAEIAHDRDDFVVAYEVLIREYGFHVEGGYARLSACLLGRLLGGLCWGRLKLGVLGWDRLEGCRHGASQEHASDSLCNVLGGYWLIGILLFGFRLLIGLLGIGLPVDLLRKLLGKLLGEPLGVELLFLLLRFRFGFRLLAGFGSIEVAREHVSA